MALKATLRRAVKQAFKALDDVPRKVTYHSMSGALVRDLDEGTSVAPTINTVLPLTVMSRFTQNDLERDALIVSTDTKLLFPREDLPQVPKSKDTFTDDTGVVWVVVRVISDPASIVSILQCRTQASDTAA